ncbi:MAG: hypothetical protein QOJ68_637 [Blastococcus sp.]|jgi:hypothetical protein|nr:hypothetical protein [Blastococcus sp.]
MNAHINYDLPQSLIRMIPIKDFADPDFSTLRHRDHVRIDRVLTSRCAASASRCRPAEIGVCGSFGAGRVVDVPQGAARRRFA